MGRALATRTRPAVGQVGDPAWRGDFSGPKRVATAQFERTREYLRWAGSILPTLKKFTQQQSTNRTGEKSRSGVAALRLFPFGRSLIRGILGA